MKILFLLILSFPVLELSILFYTISLYGWLLTFLEVFFTFVMGCFFFKRNRRYLLNNIYNLSKIIELSSHSLSNNKNSFLAVIGSIFLILPGYITDMFGLLLLIKVTQNMFLKLLLVVIKPSKIKSSETREQDINVIEGEFFDLSNENEINNNRR